MSKKLFSKGFLQIILVVTLLFSVDFISQVPPSNTRLLQVNTSKGSRLSLVSTTNSFAYHLGTISNSEVGFDGLNATNVGLDDLFILKSNVSNGSNVWFKTFNAGTNGKVGVSYVSVDSSGNLYVFGGFSGTITAGAKTITSSNANDAYLMKIDSGGNPVWVSRISNGINVLHPKVKIVSDANDVFFVGSQNLIRLNNVTGDLVYANNYPNVVLKSAALQNNVLYIAGSTISSATFGTETLPDSYSGFILRGDKNSVFSASARTVGIGSTGTKFSDVEDIEFSADGYLLVVGLNTAPINFVSETSSYNYTYTPVTTYLYNRMYYYNAKIDASLATVSFFRSSSELTSDSGYADAMGRTVNAELYPDSLGGFKILIKNDYFNGRNILSSVINTNSTTTSVTQTSGSTSYNFLVSCDSNGNSNAAAQPVSPSLKMGVASNNYVQPLINGVRLFTSTVYTTSNASALWSKSKTQSSGGSLTIPYVKHFSSMKSDVLVSSFVDGKANFFGKPISNSAGTYPRYFARLGADGLMKWSARFHPANPVREVNISSDFINTDKDDNVLFIGETSGPNATFTDALGNFADFQQPSNISAKALVKLDKNGQLLWSKQLLPSAPSGNNGIKASVSTDNVGNVYVMGTTGVNFTVDGNTISVGNSNNIFLLKFSPNGVYQYGKSYNIGAYNVNPVFDAQDNLYIFSEPINNTNLNYFSFDGVNVPLNLDYGTDHIMLKFNSSGNVIWGKNFYANATNSNYSWPNSVVFDGTDFIMTGSYYASSNSNFVGLDFANIPRVYQTNSTYIPFFAKIATSGNVIWQKPIHTNVSRTGNYTNIATDENKNIYMYWYALDKVNYNGTEYSYSPSIESKLLTKVDTNGNMKYIKEIDLGLNSPMIDVIGDDILNVVALTNQNNLLNYPINNKNASNLYVATFGDLPTTYLTPQENYLVLTNVDIPNNPNDANTFSFDLFNNVNWNASSDATWLNLSFQSLTGKYDFKNAISGTGDARIIMSAQTNNTGANRSANVLISGDQGVSTRTIVVTQTFVLGTSQAKTFITTIYPNPTSDVLNIQTEHKISRIEVYDLSGKLLKSVDGNNKKLAVSSLNKGMYIIKLYTENGVVNSKFIKN